MRLLYEVYNLCYIMDNLRYGTDIYFIDGQLAEHFCPQVGSLQQALKLAASMV